MKNFIVLLSIVALSACQNSEESQIEILPEYMQGHEILSFDISHLEADPHVQFARVIDNEGFMAFNKQIRDFEATSTPLSYSQAKNTLEELLAGINDELAKTAAEQVYSSYLLSRYLLVKQSIEGNNVEEIGYHIEKLANSYPGATQIIYTGLTHLQNHWATDKISTIAEMVINATNEDLKEQEASHAREELTTPGFESMESSVRNVMHDAEASTQTYAERLSQFIH